MENEESNPVSPTLKWAFINLLIQITLVYVFQYAGIDANNNLRFLAYVPMLICLLLAEKDYASRPAAGIITIRRGLDIALGYSLVAGILFAVFTYVYLSSLNPQILQLDLEKAAVTMKQRGMDKKEITHALEILKSTRLLFGSTGKLIAYVFLCIPFGALGAAFLRKRMTNFDGHDDPRL